MGEEPMVEVGAKIFQELVYNYRSSLRAAIIVAGWDRRKGGQVRIKFYLTLIQFKIWWVTKNRSYNLKVYTIPLGGMCVREKVSIGGSGGTYIHGFVDANYRENMDKEECIKFVATGLYVF